jgi:hypothetical protein
VPRLLRGLIVEDSKGGTDLLWSSLRAGDFDLTHQVVNDSVAMRTALAGQEWNAITSDHSMHNSKGVHLMVKLWTYSKDYSEDVGYLTIKPLPRNSLRNFDDCGGNK